MKQFTSIEKLDTVILYSLELTSSLSVLFLAFGLIVSMANVLTKGSVLADNIAMQRIWAWTQLYISRYGILPIVMCIEDLNLLFIVCSLTQKSSMVRYLSGNIHMDRYRQKCML